jgi:hypothetical protein
VVPLRQPLGRGEAGAAQLPWGRGARRRHQPWLCPQLKPQPRRPARRPSLPRPHPTPAAAQAGAAPPVLLAASHVKALDYVSLAELKEHALDAAEAEAEAAASKAGGGGKQQQQCSSDEEGGGGGGGQSAAS